MMNSQMPNLSAITEHIFSQISLKLNWDHVTALTNGEELTKPLPGLTLLSGPCTPRLPAPDGEAKTKEVQRISVSLMWTASDLG